MNKRTPRGSLWLPSLETVQVCHVDLQRSQFFLFLIRLDEELAAQAQCAGCSCGGVLHRANYPRKPRGCPTLAIRDAFSSRLSFCCSRCRRRTTSVSVRFLGRRVYLGLVVVLCSARPAGQNTAAATLCEALAVPLRTLQRWRRWWREDFMQTPLWQAMCARFMPPVSAQGLPGELLARFAGEATEALQRLLRFLAPITVRAVTLSEGR
ncbi:MAG: hypothetical protein QMC09_17670 [Thauera sp.]